MIRSDMRCVSCGTLGDWTSVYGELIRCSSCGVQVTEQEAIRATLEFEASHAEWVAQQSFKAALDLRQEMDRDYPPQEMTP